MRNRNHSILLCVLLLGWRLAFAAPETGLFDIRHRPARDLLPQVQMLLGKEGSASVFGNRLVVRAPAKRLEEVRWLISELDRAPRNLLVEVRVDRDKGGLADDAGIRLRNAQADIRFHQYSTRGSGDILQSVRTIDGRPVRIRIGQSIPVYNVERSQQGNVISERLDVKYKNIHTGIYVVPRTHGEQVTVEVYQQAEAPAFQPGHFDTQQAETIIDGRLGEWIPIGSIETTTTNRGSGLGYRAGTHMARQRYLSVRVTPLTP